MATATPVKEVRQPKQLPPPNTDSYQFAETLWSRTVRSR